MVNGGFENGQLQSLWKLLIDKNMNKKTLIALSGISTTSMAKLSKGQNIQTDALCKIFKALDCDFKDITEYVQTNAKKPRPQ